MKKKINLLCSALLGIGAMLTLNSCSDTTNDIELPQLGENTGYYILNRGSSGAGSLGLFRLGTNEYDANFFKEANDGEELGQNPTDMMFADGKLFITLTGTNQVLAIDSLTAEVEQRISVPEPRFLARRGKTIYVSHGDNMVSEIDASTMAVGKSVTVGNTPEQLIVMNNKLYVTNSGAKTGSQGGDYDNRVSVISLPSFSSVEAQISVKPNVRRIVGDDRTNMIFVNSDSIPGSTDNPSRLTSINTATNTVKTNFTFGAENLVHVATNPARIYLTSSNSQEEGDLLRWIDASTDVVTNLPSSTAQAITRPTSMQLLPTLLARDPFIAVTDAKDGNTAGEVVFIDWFQSNSAAMKIPAGINPVKMLFLSNERAVNP